MKGYLELGSVVSYNHLKSLREQVCSLKSSVKEAQKEWSDNIRPLEEALIRIRISNKSTNLIFGETILLLLKTKPLLTTELQAMIQDIHSDICDNTVDRIIDGEHFGKLWKHQVRNAQQSLKKSGKIAQDSATKRWFITG